MTEVHYVLLTADEFHRIQRGEAVVPESLKEKAVDSQDIPKSPQRIFTVEFDYSSELENVVETIHRNYGTVLSIVPQAPHQLREKWVCTYRAEEAIDVEVCT